jgi:hypothetical protein
MPRRMTEMERRSEAEDQARQIVETLPEDLVQKWGAGQIISDLTHELLLSGLPSEELVQQLRDRILAAHHTPDSM